MSTHQSADKKAGKKDGQDLTTVLNQTQRADLTLLIATITDSMRNVVLDNFDASASLNTSHLNTSHTAKDVAADGKAAAAEAETAPVHTAEQHQKLKEQYERDLSSPEMVELKEKSLQAFDQWREQVLMRVGEVVNNRETAKTQLRSTTSDGTNPEAPAATGTIIDISGKDTTLKFNDIYPPTKNSLTTLSMADRRLVLHSTLLLMLSLEHYNAASRVLLLFLTSSLELPLTTFEQDESATAKGLLEGVKHLSAEDEKNKRVEDSKDSLKWKVWGATAAGAALIGVTGGLAAPLVAAGVGSLLGAVGLGATSAGLYLGSLAGSTYLVGGLFGAYGGRMTGTMVDNYAREVQDFEFLSVHSSKKTSDNEKEAAKEASDNDHKLRLTICISGWLTEKDEVLKPWRVIGTTSEVFALKYELAALMHLGNALYSFASSKAWAYAKKEIISRTVLAGVWAARASAMWPITLLKTSRVLDNPFNIAILRSDKAGEVLADALINKAQGERPVTLVGYSLGARVIFSCLKSLARRGAFGLVENAVLVGAAAPSYTSEWRILRSVVSGRLVNVYSKNDYVLGFMYRSQSWQYGVAGLQAVEGLTGVENVDVTEEVNGHLRYRYLQGSILQRIGFEDVDAKAVEKEKELLAHAEKVAQAETEKALQADSTEGTQHDEHAAEREALEIEKEVEAKTQKSMGTEDKSAAESKAKGSVPDASEADSGSSEQAQSYASRAAGWLPSMPKSWSSIPGLPTRGKPQTDEQPPST